MFRAAASFSIASLSLILAAGCVSPNVETDRALNRLRAGDDPAALAWAEGLKSSMYSKRLGNLEAGRIRMLGGEFAGSADEFARVIGAVIERNESGPVIRLGAVGAQTLAGTLADDRVRAYTPPAYEFVQALSYQMLNHLFLGNLDAAGVEARRAVFAQEAIADTYGREVRDARIAARRAGQADAVHQVNARMRNMAPVLETVGSSFENALTWYLCGVILEQQDDLANAALSYRKSWELAPANAFMRDDCLRLIRTQDPAAFEALAAREGIGAALLKRPRSEVILIVEESFVSQRLPVKCTLPVAGTLVSLDFPAYQDAPFLPATMEVWRQGVTCGQMAPALSLQALAYRDLDERMPGIVLRNLTRAATHIAAQHAANRQSDGVRYGVLAANLFTAVFGGADTRAWNTLPMSAQIYRGGVPPGEHLFELRNRATGAIMRFQLRLAQDETRLVWVADIGGNARVATASLNGRGSRSTYDRCPSILPGQAHSAGGHGKGGRKQ